VAIKAVSGTPQRTRSTWRQFLRTQNCEDALVAGSGNPQVRAGVLRLVSALADIAAGKF
jgi:hypothetical protein